MPLINPGFEDDNAKPAGWNLAAIPGSPMPDLWNIESAGNNAGPASRLTGNNGLRVGQEGNFHCWECVVYQTVDDVAAGQRLDAGAWAVFWSGENWDFPMPDAVNVFAQVGIDPSGGVDPASQGVIWGQRIEPRRKCEPNRDAKEHQLAEVRDVPAQGDRATMFIRLNCGWVGRNDAGGPPCRWEQAKSFAFVDDAYLRARWPDGGGQPPQPRPEPEPDPEPIVAIVYEVDLTLGGMPLRGTVRRVQVG